LDVSLKEISILVRRNRNWIWPWPRDWRSQRPLERGAKHARCPWSSRPARAGFHRKPDGLPAVGIYARDAKAALEAAQNKTGANDASAWPRILQNLSRKALAFLHRASIRLMLWKSTFRTGSMNLSK